VHDTSRSISAYFDHDPSIARKLSPEAGKDETPMQENFEKDANDGSRDETGVIRPVLERVVESLKEWALPRAH
jgi:hypothetical protein